MAAAILIPTDFSQCAQAAMQSAEQLARATDSDLLIVHVRPGNLLPHALDDVDDADEHADHDALNEWGPADSNISCARRFLRGDPPKEILDIADAEDVAMIVIGTHGQTNSPDVPLGAIAKAVILGSSHSVIAVKPASD